MTMDANTVIKDWPNAGDPDIPLVTTDQLAKAAKGHKTTIPVG